MNARTRWWLLSGTLAAALACASDEAEQGAADPCAGVNVLSVTEQAEGWTLLFGGESLSGWHGYNGGTLESWTIEDCAIKSVGTEGNYGSDMRADLVTDGEFTSFELSIDWKASEGGNSGLMYGVIEAERYDAAWKTGPEYQFVDDVGFASELEEWQTRAALAERGEGRGVRALDRRVGEPQERREVEGRPRLRQCRDRPHRDPGPRQRVLVPERQDPGDHPGVAAGTRRLGLSSKRTPSCGV
jgi:hypothetical protein